MPIWTPSQIATALWLDGSDASTLYDATSGGSLVAADGQVARWEDKSGNAKHATQGAAGSRPLRKIARQNGLDAILFDGTDDLMANTLANVTTGNEKTVIAIAKSKHAGGGTIFGSRLNNRHFIARILQSGGTSFASGDATTTNVSTTFDFTTPMQSYMLHAFRSPASLIIEYRAHGLTRTTSGTILSDTGGTGFAVGSIHASAFQTWPGDICEVIVLDSYASTATVELCEGYLAWKWGTVATLDASHPYKSAAPRFGGGGRLINGTSLVRPAGIADNSPLIIGAT